MTRKRIRTILKEAQIAPKKRGSFFMAISPENRILYLGKLHDIARTRGHNIIFENTNGVDRVSFQSQNPASSTEVRDEPLRIALEDEKVRLSDVYIFDGVPHVSVRTYGRPDQRKLILTKPDEVPVTASDLKLS